MTKELAGNPLTGTGVGVGVGVRVGVGVGSSGWGVLVAVGTAVSVAVATITGVMSGDTAVSKDACAETAVLLVVSLISVLSGHRRKAATPNNKIPVIPNAIVPISSPLFCIGENFREL